MENEEIRKKRWNKGGRPPKNDPTVHRYSVNFSAVEHAKFLSMFDESGVYSKAAFIKARVFDQPFKVIKIDRGMLEYRTKLTTFLGQFRSIGVNYNQVVKELRIHFSEKRALTMLYKLEKMTKELVAVGQQIIALTEEFKMR